MPSFPISILKASRICFGRLLLAGGLLSLRRALATKQSKKLNVQNNPFRFCGSRPPDCHASQFHLNSLILADKNDRHLSFLLGGCCKDNGGKSEQLPRFTCEDVRRTFLFYVIYLSNDNIFYIDGHYRRFLMPSGRI